MENYEDRLLANIQSLKKGTEEMKEILEKMKILLDKLRKNN